MKTISQNMEWLVSFYSVANEGGFSKAAIRLQKSKSHLSQQVRRLEAHLGTTLFLRTTRSFALTSGGRELLKVCEKIFKLSDEAEGALKEGAQHTEGILRLSLSPSLSVLMPVVMTRFHEELPLVAVEFDYSNEDRDLAGSDFDFAIRASSEITSLQDCTSLGRIRDALFASPKFAAQMKHINLSEIESVSAILNSDDESRNVLRFNQDVFQLKGNLITNTYESALMFCKSGMGVALLPLYLAAPACKTKALAPVFPELQLHSKRLYLIHPKREYLLKKQRVMKKILIETFRSHEEYFRFSS